MARPVPGAAALARSDGERRQLRRAVIASTVGTSIEWYDFFLYNTIAALVFGKLFFPTADPLTGTLFAFATNFGGFAARPIGAAIFGHFGDRIGRKATLISTLLFMGLATFIIGLIPGYGPSSFFGAAFPGWGVAATVLLVVLRSLQGIGVGGEWGGSVLLAMEWGHRGKRGLIASWPQAGVPIGLLLSTVLTSIISAATGANFLVWGWRIPFLLSIVLVGIVGMIVWIIPYFALLNTKVPALIVLAIVVSLIPHDMQYGPQAALIAEVFTGRLRYSGASLGYQLASVIAGGPAPLIATRLLASYHSSGPIAAYVIIISLIGLAATAVLRERSKQDIAVEYEEQDQPRGVAPGAAPRIA